MNSSYSCNYLISKNKELFGKKEKEEEKEKKGFLSMPESRIRPWSDMVHLYWAHQLSSVKGYKIVTG